MDDTYTLDQIVDAIIQAADDVVTAIAYQDKEMLEDILRDYLH